MELPGEEVERVFRKVAAVRAHLKKTAVEGLQPELNWESLADIIADMYALHISIVEVLAHGTTVAGMVERYEDGRALILVKSKQSDEMQRFVIVKELSHLMIDEKDDWSNDGLLTIREMKVEFDLAKKDGNGVIDPTRRQMSEYLALIAAVALAYPCEYHESDYDKVDKDRKTIGKIALEHKVPAWAIELAFTHRYLFSLYKEED